MPSGRSAVLLLLSVFATLAARTPVECQDGGVEVVAPNESELLIVAPRALASSLADYVVQRRQRMPTDLVELESIFGDSSEREHPERLKRFLYDCWRHGSLRYVLLVGDAHLVPVRYMVLDRVTTDAFDTAFYPSDLYYADLAAADGSFDDWNGNREGHRADYYGEVRGEKHKDGPINADSIHYHPEIAVGRWPVTNSEEVGILAAKTLRFEARPRNRPRAVFVVVDGWVDSRARMHRAAEALAGWQLDELYYGRSREPSEDTIVDLLNDGVDLVAHSGHGSSSAWATCFPSSALPRLDNAGHPAIMLSAGCSTARLATLPPYEPYRDIDGRDHRGTKQGQVFDSPPPPPSPYQRGTHNPTGLGERLLVAGPEGAVAYFGCNTGSQPCGLTLIDGMLAGFAAEDCTTIGDAWRLAIDHYVEQERLEDLRPTKSWYPPSIFFQGMKFMLFGDPSLALPEPRSEESRPPMSSSGGDGRQS